jgi:hypothetical protein
MDGGPAGDFRQNVEGVVDTALQTFGLRQEGLSRHYDATGTARGGRQPPASSVLRGSLHGLKWYRGFDRFDLVRPEASA